MIRVESIALLKEERAFAWNVVFTLEGASIKYATDVLYAVRRNYWVVSPCITHDLSSLMEGNECPFCRRGSVACHLLSERYKEVTEALLRHRKLQKPLVEKIKTIKLEDFPTNFIVEKDRGFWDDIIYENTTEKLIRKGKLAETVTLQE